jgi:hypothetical protein
MVVQVLLYLPDATADPADDKLHQGEDDGARCDGGVEQLHTRMIGNRIRGGRGQRSR